MAAPTNSGEWDMPTEDFALDLFSLLVSPRWSPLRLTPSPPRHFLPSSSSMVMLYQGSDYQYSTDNPLQNEQHPDEGIIDPAPYLAGDSALLQQLPTVDESNMDIYFPPSPPYFPLCQRLLEVKSSALHLMEREELEDISDGFLSYEWKNLADHDVDQIAMEAVVLPKEMGSLMDDILEESETDYEKFRRINCLEQHEQDMFVVQLILGGVVCTINRMELFLKLSVTVWLRHGGQWEADADAARSNSGCLGKRKRNEMKPGGMRRSKKTNGVRTAIPREDILQAKGMRRKEAAKHLGVSISKLKSSCRDSGIRRWPPRNEHKLIRQPLPNEILAVDDQEEFPQLTSHNLPFDQALTATIDTNGVDKEISLSQFLPIAQQKNLDAGFGNDEEEAIGMEVEGTREGVMEEAQLNSRCSGIKGKKKVNTLGEEGGNNITTGVRIAITMEDILKVKGMSLNDAAKRLEVSRSTLKRACREYGIKRWPPRKEHEPISRTRPNESPAVEHELISQTRPNSQTQPNEFPAVEVELISHTRPNESPAVEVELISHTRPNESPAVVDQEQTQQLNSDAFLPTNQVSTTMDTKAVKLKARYEGSTITFRLSWPLRKVELEQEVKKRLQLEAGNYNISYKDEDDDLVLIACDDDLEECITSSCPLGSRCHELFLTQK